MKQGYCIYKVSSITNFFQEMKREGINVSKFIAKSDLKYFNLSVPSNTIPSKVLHDFLRIIKRENSSNVTVMVDRLDLDLFVCKDYPDTKITVLVEKVLESYQSGYIPTLKILSEHFNTSESTFKRLLKSEKTQFSKILEEILFHKAVTLLSKSDLNIVLVSEQLGYSESTNFIRSFKKWTGITPAVYRNNFIY